jgi:hypothetical protein
MADGGDWFAKTIALASLAVSIVGLGSVVISIQSLRQADDAARANVTQQVIGDSMDVDKIFIQHPEMRPFFRDRKPIRPGDEGYDRAAAIAELRANALDAILVFPGVSAVGNWTNVARSIFRDSPIMCEFVSKYKDNYSAATVKIAGEACQTASR